MISLKIWEYGDWGDLGMRRFEDSGIERFGA